MQLIFNNWLPRGQDKRWQCIGAGKEEVAAAGAAGTQGDDHDPAGHGAAELQQQAGRASIVVQLVKNLPATQETPVQSLGWKDPLEKETATYSRILVGRIPWAVKSMGSQRVGHD